jgi:hypothetical protein
MRKFPAPGSKTAPNCEKGLSAGRPEREKARKQRLVGSLPRIRFNVEGIGYFTPANQDELEGLRLAAPRKGWILPSLGSVGVAVEIVCLVKSKAYQRCQYNQACVEAVGRLEFHGATATFQHNADADLVNGLEILAKRNGWTVEHHGKKATVNRSARKAA